MALHLATIAAALAATKSQAEIKQELFASYDKTLRPSLWVSTQQEADSGEQSCGAAPPEHVETQLSISKISVGLQQYEIEGYFRLWWVDPRLAFNGTSEVRCGGGGGSTDTSSGDRLTRSHPSHPPSP